MGAGRLTTFELAIGSILEIEKERANDPADPGGETVWGLSRRANPGIPWPPSRLEAIDVYRRKYWDGIHLDSLPPAVAYLVFDAAVNQGPRRAVRWLQSVLQVAVDGELGPETAEAARVRRTRDIVLDFAARRAVAYALDPDFSRYGLGWMRRVMSMTASALTLVRRPT